eukprot:m.242972 g.242972  ORF g.242972 m.242972 type:complete len:64 (+) comp33805_c3_seq15:200-391(+)
MPRQPSSFAFRRLKGPPYLVFFIMLAVTKQHQRTLPQTKAKEISETTTSADAQDVLEILFAPE